MIWCIATMVLVAAFILAPGEMDPTAAMHRKIAEDDAKNQFERVWRKGTFVTVRKLVQ